MTSHTGKQHAAQKADIQTFQHCTTFTVVPAEFKAVFLSDSFELCLFTPCAPSNVGEEAYLSHGAVVVVVVIIVIVVDQWEEDSSAFFKSAQTSET